MDATRDFAHEYAHFLDYVVASHVSTLLADTLMESSTKATSLSDTLDERSQLMLALESSHGFSKYSDRRKTRWIENPSNSLPYPERPIEVFARLVEQAVWISCLRSIRQPADRTQRLFDSRYYWTYSVFLKLEPHVARMIHERMGLLKFSLHSSDLQIPGGRTQ